MDAKESFSQKCKSCPWQGVRARIVFNLAGMCVDSQILDPNFAARSLAKACPWAGHYVLEAPSCAWQSGYALADYLASSIVSAWLRRVLGGAVTGSDYSTFKIVKAPLVHTVLSRSQAVVWLVRQGFF